MYHLSKRMHMKLLDLRYTWLTQAPAVLRADRTTCCKAARRTCKDTVSVRNVSARVGVNYDQDIHSHRATYQ